MESSRIHDLNLRETIVRYILRGDQPDVAARAAGLSRDTFIEWLRRGQNDADGPYADFFQAIDQADAQCETRATGKLYDIAIDGDSKALIEFLGRRYPKNWSQKTSQRLEIVKNEQELLDTPSEVNDPQRAAALDAYYRELTGLNPGAVEGSYRDVEETDSP